MPIRCIRANPVWYNTTAHNPTGLAQLAQLRQQLAAPAAPCLGAIETAYNLVLDFLWDHEYIIYGIPPRATNRDRDRHRARRRNNMSQKDKQDERLPSGAIVYWSRMDKRGRKYYVPAWCPDCFGGFSDQNSGEAGTGNARGTGLVNPGYCLLSPDYH